MAVVFNSLPSTLRVPGSYAEIDDSQALKSQGQEPHTVLLIGVRLSTGTATEGEIKEIIGLTDGDAYFGSKSQLAAMCYFCKRVNKTARVYAMALDEASGGTAATSTFPFTGTSTADGTLRVRIGDTRVSVSLSSGTTAAQAATALSTAINATDRLIVSSSPSTGTVTLTCRHKGEMGNDITLEVELIPAGLACTPTQPSIGATNPDMATAIAAFADTRYDTIVTGLTDDDSMDALEDAMEARWDPAVKQPGMVIACVRGSHGTLTTYGSARNSPYSIVPGAGLSPTPPWVIAAQVAARDAQRCDTQPNRPLNGKSLPDVEAPKPTEAFDISERNLLLFDGISTLKVDSSGNVLIERLITTYQTNTSGLNDATYLASETMRNLADLYLSSLQVASRFDDYLLAPDGTNADPGVPLLTPAIFKGVLVGWYEGKERAGRVTDTEGFAADLIVEINEDNHERLDVQMSPRLVNGKVVTAMKISFQL